MVEVQQNLRSALQLVSQDLRAGAFLHLWHAASCNSGTACSTDEQIALITTDGVMTTVPESPGISYVNSGSTFVCDARDFGAGTVGLVYNNGSVDVVRQTAPTLTADHSQPCAGGVSPNRDQVNHAADRISGQWSASSYVYRAVVANYYLAADPVDESRTALFRRTGLGAAQAQSGLVAFGVTGLSFAYGVPVDPSAAASQLVFYPSLEDAVSALGSDYSAYPRAAGKTYVGSVVEAVRVELVGETRGSAAGGGQPRTFTLTETVELRR